MRFGSVCSGIEAASVAWEPLGWTPAWFCEIDPFASALLAHRFPGVPNHGDFTALLNPTHAVHAEPIDVLVGGTPCQAFSVAGLRQGLADHRGSLTLEFLRLAQALRPKWIVWENVPGVLSQDGGRAFGAFLGGLENIGYGFAYRVLDAQYFGLAQRRKRVFVVGCAGAESSRAGAVLFEPEGVRRDSPPSQAPRQGSAGNAGGLATLGGGGIAHTLRGEGHDAGEDGTGRGTPLVACGPLPFDTTQITSRLNRSTPRAGDIFHPPTAGEHPPAICYTGDNRVADPLSANEQKTYSHEGSSFRLHNCVDQCIRGVRRLTPRECERLQGFPDNWTIVPYLKGESRDSNRYRSLGNSMAVPVMRWIGERIKLVDGAIEP